MTVKINSAPSAEKRFDFGRDKKMPEELKNLEWLILCVGFSLFCLLFFIITLIVCKSYVKRPTQAKYKAAGVLNGFTVFFFILNIFIFLMSIVLIILTAASIIDTVSNGKSADYASPDSILIYIADVLPIIAFCFGIKAMSAHGAAVRVYRFNHPIPVQMPGYMTYSPMPDRYYPPEGDYMMPNAPSNNGAAVSGDANLRDAYSTQTSDPVSGSYSFRDRYYSADIENNNSLQVHDTDSGISVSDKDGIIRCQNCGADNSNINRFCVFCGRQIKD